MDAFLDFLASCVGNYLTIGVWLIGALTGVAVLMAVVHGLRKVFAWGEKNLTEGG